MDDLLARLDAGTQVPEFELRQEAATEIRRLRGNTGKSAVRVVGLDDTEDWPFIRTTREAFGITQAELGAIVGASTATVADWEADADTITDYDRAMLGKMYQATRVERGLESVSEMLAAHGAIYTLMRLLSDGFE